MPAAIGDDIFFLDAVCNPAHEADPHHPSLLPALAAHLVFAVSLYKKLHEDRLIPEICPELTSALRLTSDLISERILSLTVGQLVGRSDSQAMFEHPDVVIDNLRRNS